MVAPIPEPDPSIDPTEPVPDDPGELLPDAPEPLPPPPIESTPDDPGGDPAECRNPPELLVGDRETGDLAAGARHEHLTAVCPEIVG